MDAIYLYAGDTIPHTASGDVAAGDVLVIGDTVAIAKYKIPDTETGVLDVVGAFTMPKATTSASAIAAGKKVYWNASGEVVTETAGSNKVAGYTVEAAADADATVRVRLSRS